MSDAKLRAYQNHCDRLRKEMAVVSPLLLVSATFRRIAREFDTDKHHRDMNDDQQEALHDALLELADHLEKPIRVRMLTT